MNIGESFRTGFVEIYSHKLRSFLSFSAIAFGVAAILYTFANVNRMYERRRTAMELAGPGRIRINVKRQKGDDEVAGLSKGLTRADAEAIRRTLPWLYMVSPTLRIHASVHYEDFREYVQLQGITPEWRRRGWVFTLRGRFINQHDMDSAARVCLFNEPGGWAEEKPFWARWWKDDEFDALVKHRDMLGKTVRIKDQLFTVIGILKNPPKDKDPRWFRWGGGKIYVPLTTAQRYLSQSRRGEDYISDTVDQIIIDSGDPKTVAQAKRRIENLLDARHRGVKDYELEDFREMVRGMLNRMRQQAIAVLSVGIIAILAGGVGIMNVTLATIFSRIREIGIRRAIGATKSDILSQFIIEAMMLGFLGGVAGIAIGMSGIHFLVDDAQEQIEALLWWHFLATLAISVGAGFVFSLYPAYQASKLDPVEALRYE